MRRRIVWVAVGLAWGLVVLGVFPGMADAGERPKVKVAMDWIIGGRHAPFFVAAEKGYYAEEGLDVEVLRGFGSASTIQRIISGEVQFAYVDFPSSVLARNEGTKARTIMMVLGRNPVTFFSLKKTNITKPKDLEGRSIVTNAGSAASKLFPAFAEMNGVDHSKVKWVAVEPAAKASMLIAGSADLVEYFLMQKPLLEREAAKLGGINQMVWADYGFPLYGNGIMAMEEYLAKNGDVVRRFLRASVKGFHQTFDNPHEATALVRKTHPTLDPAVTKAEVEILKNLVLTEDAKANGIGFMTEEKVKANRDIMVRVHGLKGQIATGDLYSNEFLPKK